MGCRMWDVGYGIWDWDVRYGMWDTGYGIRDMGYKMWDTGLWDTGLWDKGHRMPPLLRAHRHVSLTPCPSFSSPSSIPDFRTRLGSDQRCPFAPSPVGFRKDLVWPREEKLKPFFLPSEAPNLYHRWLPRGDVITALMNTLINRALHLLNAGTKTRISRGCTWGGAEGQSGLWSGSEFLFRLGMSSVHTEYRLESRLYTKFIIVIVIIS